MYIYIYIWDLNMFYDVLHDRRCYAVLWYERGIAQVTLPWHCLVCTALNCVLCYAILSHIML